MNVENILDNINFISEKLFKSVEEQVYKVLDELVIIGPDILKDEPLKNICYSDKINGVIIIANSLILFYIIYFVFDQIINLYNGKSAENMYKFIIKVVIIGIAVNFSYYICEEILYFFKLLSDSVDLFCKEITNIEICFVSLKEIIINIKDFLNEDLLSLNGLIKGMVSFGSVSILINFSIRYVTIIFLIIISPFALISLLSNITSGIFKSWGKLLITNLLVQIIVKFLLVIPIVYKNTNSIMYKIILVGSIYLIYKINIFTKDIFIKITEDTKVFSFLKD